MHLDLYVTTADEFGAAHERALALGARLIFDRSADPEEPLYVYADPAGHPFCIFSGRRRCDTGTAQSAPFASQPGSRTAPAGHGRPEVGPG